MKFIFERLLFITLGLTSILTSCVSVGKISIQVAVPPPKVLPEDIQSLTIMNRSMTADFSNLSKDSLENLFVEKRLMLDATMKDSLAADTTVQVIGNALYESGRFDVMIPLKRNLLNFSNARNEALPSLKLPEVKQVCSEFKTDALLTLERFSEKVATSYHIDVLPIPDMNFNKEYAIFIQVVFHSDWKLYQPGEKLKVATFTVQDTIYYNSNGFSLQDTYEKMPTIKEALLGGAVENARIMASFISPGWETQIRNYFLTGNTEADKAVALLQDNKWSDAANLWNKFIHDKSPGFRSKIEFNLALAAEMNGDLDGAIVLAKKSFASKYSTYAENYVKMLQSRKALNP
ncbi:MAG: DUF6340 family protein [Marinilabiliales bacterium]|nr:DUF6340 family protein [Marinilabiliales bacterium]